MSAPSDAQARTAIARDTRETMFVSAGAGSGKTAALVDRVRTLVLDDGVPMSAVATVTFTEKAGAELRDRLRASFERASAEGGEGQDRARQALDDLDGAAIGTLHSFAQRVLAEYPVQAGLPPLIEVLDEVGSSVAFEERWAEMQSQLLDDEDAAPALRTALALGVKLRQLQSLASSLGRDWDLLEERILVDPPSPFRIPDTTALIAAARDLAASASCCTDDSDLLLTPVLRLPAFIAVYEQAPDAETRIATLAELADVKFTRGRKENWTRPVADVRAEGAALTDRARQIVAEVADTCLRTLTRWLAGKVTAAAHQRRAAGRLEFHDLLVLARDLVRRHPDVRDGLQRTYRRLLLDEFQDSDPIQIELTVRVCGGRDAAQPRWQDVDLPPGRLFVVGDAKQSIYRFRRASIATYLQARSHIGKNVELTTNFRTVPPVLDWVNAVFARLIQPVEDAQPEFVPLHSYRTDTPAGPAVLALGAAAHSDSPNAAALREREAADVAAVIRRALDEGWQVLDTRTQEQRLVRRSDIAVLLPARTSLANLEDALDRAGIPYRAEANSLVYQSEEVRSLLAAARAVADPSDALSLVTALRSPLFGCGDDDLWRWKHAGGRFSIFAELDGSLGQGPVGRALTYLRMLLRRSRWMTPSELLAEIVTDRRMYEVAATGPRARDGWRRLRFVVDQARAWCEVSHGGLRAYLEWAARQGQEVSRVAEAVLPESDVDTVRIMTVHAAKGLEFPIVILSGTTSQARRSSGVSLLWPSEGGYAVRLRSELQTGDFEAAVPVDEQMGELERTRLLYVAATRARDHLVVSLHRAEGSKANTAAKLFADAGGADAPLAESFVREERDDRAGASPTSPAVTPPSDRATWQATVDDAQEASRTSAAISASGLEGTEPAVVLDPNVDPGTGKGPRSLDLPPWSKGRYGSAIGRAVHGVLQVVELHTGAGLDGAVAAQAAAEGVAGQEELVRDLVSSALASPLVRAAAEREHWRESYVGTVEADGTVLEGYVDLIYRDDDGTLVIVDYKTDAVPARALDSRVSYYRPQLEAYRTALTAASGQRVRAVLLFLHPGNAAAVELD